MKRTVVFATLLVTGGLSLAVAEMQQPPAGQSRPPKRRHRGRRWLIVSET